MKASVLFVLWHCPQPSSYHAIGRLVRVDHEDGVQYEFAYLRGVQAVQNEAPRIGGFPELHRRYVSTHLFPFFANRLMDRRRGDFPAYVASLGFDSAPDDHLQLLTRDGRKGTDRFETFGYPDFDPEQAKLHWHFWLRGIRWQENAEQRSSQLQPGQRLTVRPDRANQADPHAVEVLPSADEPRIGFVPRFLNRELLLLFKAGANPEVLVTRVNQPPNPVQQRVLCELRADWPPDYVPLHFGEMQPIPADSWNLSELMDARTRALLVAKPA